MTLKEEFLLQHYKKCFGEMTSNEALEIALISEQYARDCSAFDPAMRKFLRDSFMFEEYALLLEKEPNQ